MTKEFEELDIPEFDFEGFNKNQEDDNPGEENQDQEDLDKNDGQDDDQESNDDQQDDNSADDASDDNYIKAAYEMLTTFGILETDDAFDNKSETLESKLEELPDKLLNSAIAQLPKASQKLLSFAANAKEDVTIDELFSFVKSLKEETTEVVIETADEAREFLAKQLSAQGLSKRAIDVELDELEENDKLLETAKAKLASLPKKTDQLIDNKKESQVAKQQATKQFYSAIQQELETAGWKKSKQQEIINTAPKANNILAEVMSSPKAYVQLIDFLTKFKGKEFDLSDYEKRGESKATSNIKSIIQKNSISSGTTGTKAAEGEKHLQDILKRYEPVVN